MTEARPAPAEAQQPLGAAAGPLRATATTGGPGVLAESAAACLQPAAAPPVLQPPAGTAAAVVPAAADKLARCWQRVNAAVSSPPERRSVHAFRQRPLVYAAMLGYAVASIALMFGHQVGLTSEHVILLLLVAFAVIGRARPFVWDWLPFLFVAVMFEDLTSVGAKIAGSVHELGPIVFERTIFGGVVVCSWLQQHLDVGFVGHTLGVLLGIEYLFHFAAPLVFGLWLWLRHRDRFGVFVGAYFLVMSTGFIAYLLFPEVPPWLAAQHGDLPQVHRIVVEMLQNLGGFGNFYAGADPEPNAAMPSLHVSVPLVIAMSVVSVHGWRNRRAWLWMLYPATISFGVVYLGEHYVADVAVALVLGAACWAVADLGRVHGLRRRLPQLAAVSVASTGRRPLS